ncbi:MAG TPA: hypothetical protein ENF21_07025 [Bacteroidetes bacterium]|nr:hypothetical protein [Bacteroidota bacterium]
MKNYIIKLSLVLSVVLLFSACEQERIMFDTSLAVVGFQSASFTIPEAEGDSIILYLGAASGTEPTEVTLEVSTEGHANPAIEGEDYTIESKQVTLEVGITKVAITPVDNDIFTGDKTFTVTIVSNSKDYEQAVQSSAVITIKDDEHPLLNWLGTYIVDAVSYDGPGVYDERWTVSVTPVPGTVDKVNLVGIAGSSSIVVATIDKENLTITVEPGQEIGDVYGYGPTGVFWGGNLKDITWSTPSEELYAEAGETLITGTVSEDGSEILIDDWAHLLLDYEGFIYDVFNTTWTKQ